MGSMTKSLVTKLAVFLGFAATAVVNWLATVGKINGLTTAAVSDAHPSLFTPAGYTFSIWGIIYLLLLIYVLFALFTKNLGKNGRLSKTAVWFAVTCVLNVGWLIAWHYGLIALSTAAIGLLLYALVNILILVSRAERSFGYLISLEFPFGLYAGWITVATVANIAVLLSHVGWDGFGIPWFLWLIAVLLTSTLIAVAATHKTLNLAYPAAVIWGFTGILVRYLPDFKIDLQSETMWIVIALVLCLAILTIRWIDAFIRRVK